MTAAVHSHRGGCHCGAVRYETEGPLRPVVYCHCRQCRRIHGLFAAYSATPRTAFRLLESRGLRWYAASAHARRGFCAECGASLFWEPAGADYISLAAGSLEEPTGLSAEAHIFVADKGDYYELCDALPHHAGAPDETLPGLSVAST